MLLDLPGAALSINPHFCPGMGVVLPEFNIITHRIAARPGSPSQCEREYPLSNSHDCKCAGKVLQNPTFDEKKVIDRITDCSGRRQRIAKASVYKKRLMRVSLSSTDCVSSACSLTQLAS